MCLRLIFFLHCDKVEEYIVFRVVRQQHINLRNMFVFCSFCPFMKNFINKNIHLFQFYVIFHFFGKKYIKNYVIMAVKTMYFFQSGSS